MPQVVRRTPGRMLCAGTAWWLLHVARMMAYAPGVLSDPADDAGGVGEGVLQARPVRLRKLGVVQ
jgi:hypothetical protein